MSADLVGATAAATGDDDLLSQFVRWVASKSWFACLLSAGAVVRHQYGWPQILDTALAVLGGLALALAAWYLPIWTRHHRTGILPVDVGLRLAAWGFPTVSVVALLVGRPLLGMVALALLLMIAGRAFGHRFAPLVARIRYQGRTR